MDIACHVAGLPACRNADPTRLTVRYLHDWMDATRRRDGETFFSSHTTRIRYGFSSTMMMRNPCEHLAGLEKLRKDIGLRIICWMQQSTAKTTTTTSCGATVTVWQPSSQSLRPWHLQAKRVLLPEKEAVEAPRRKGRLIPTRNQLLPLRRNFPRTNAFMQWIPRSCESFKKRNHG
jgi:hypothetical protein